MIAPALRLLPGALASVLLLAGPAEARSKGTEGGIQGGVRGYEEVGQASWYGAWHHGRRTSSGAIFDQHALTAAHATLPLGSRVRVTLRDTGRSVVVTVNDRQPPKGVRVIDLSRGAAQRLGIVERGLGWVTITPAHDEEPVEVAEAPDDTDTIREVWARRRATGPNGAASAP